MFALPVADYETAPEIDRFRRKVTDDLRASVLQSFLPAFEERYAQRQKLPPPDYVARIQNGDELLSGLQRDGYALGALPESRKARVRDLVWPLALETQAALEAIDTPKFAAGQTRLGAMEAEVVEQLSQGMTECGALDALCAYVGAPLKLIGAVLQVNTARETQAKYGELDALGRPARATSYFHVDSSHWPNIKALVYLDDVGPEQGPFRYVAGSHRLMSAYEAAVRKTNDKLGHGLDKLCALPPEYAQHANFGDFIDPASEGALRLLEREVVVCDGRSDLVLFDNNGVHRGGMVRQGHRYMLQCGFKP